MNPEKEYSVWSAGGIGASSSKPVKPPPVDNSHVQEGCERFTEATAQEYFAVKDERDCLRDKVVILNEALRVHKEALAIAFHVLGEHDLLNAIARIKRSLELFQ